MQLRTELFAKMLCLPVGYFNENGRGRLMSRITNDANSITGAGFNVLTVVAKDGLTVVGLLAWLLYLDWQLTLITLVTLPVIGWCVRKINKRLRGLAYQNQQVVGQMTQVLTESIDGARVVRVYGGQAHEQNRMETANRRLRHNVVKQASSGAISSAVTQLLIVISLSLILYFAA